MNNQITKYLLPLAALALVSVACDPFPAAPGGAPTVVRVTTSSPDGDSSTVENTDGDGTVSTDYAWVNDNIWVQFNKPMDGSSIQSNAQYDKDGKIVVDPTGAPIPCVKAAGITLSASFDAATEVCYEPNSPTDGGYLRVKPGAPLAINTTYTITGSVKDYQGNALTINVTVTVDKRPLPFARSSDGYSTGLDWFDSGADSYDVLFATANAAGTGPGTFVHLWTINPADDCDGVWCSPYAAVTGYHTMLVPQTEYWYQVTETTGGVTTPRPAVAGPVTTVKPLLPTFGVTSTTTLPPAVIPGVIRVAWPAVKGVSGYQVEQAPDNAGAPGTWAVVAASSPAVASPFYLAGGPATGTPLKGTLTSGATYWFRVTPVYPAPPAGYVPVVGRQASKASP